MKLPHQEPLLIHVVCVLRREMMLLYLLFYKLEVVIDDPITICSFPLNVIAQKVFRSDLLAMSIHKFVGPVLARRFSS